MKWAAMLGEPQDVEGECNALVFIADNYGDGCATIRCQLPLAHDGMHREQFVRDGGTIAITWDADERVRCDHGCGQWDHDHRDEILCPKHADDHEFSDCAHCHPDAPALTCIGCGKIHFYETGHKRSCLKEPYTCVTCGESGVGPHDWPYGCPSLWQASSSAQFAGGNADGSTSDLSSTELPALVEIQAPSDLAMESLAGSRPTLNVHLVEIQPHPDLATTHPGWWRTKLAISYAGTSSTFWRWHKAPSEKTPTADEIHAWFWQTTFAELHGFSFDE
jgi:hypothetical protein